MIDIYSTCTAFSMYISSLICAFLYVSMFDGYLIRPKDFRSAH